jgi:hypothetical protein
MKLGMAICLSLGVCSSPLLAQQTVLASSALTPIKFSAAPVSSVPPAPHHVPLYASALGETTSIYETAIAEPELAVCTQAISRAVEPHDEYAFDRLHFTAASIKATFSHANMAKMARNFVPGQQLPEEPYFGPLTVRQKFDAFLRQSHSASLGVGILSDALISQATGAYPRLGGGWRGFGQRLGVSTAGNEAAAFFGGFLYPTVFHQDPRYFPSHENGIANRIAYAASRALIGRSDTGWSVINNSVIASQFTQAAIANTYIPYRNQTAGGTVENALIGIAGVAEENILKEFWPDIKEFVARHTTNRWIKRGMAMGDPTTPHLYRQ